MIDEQTDKRPVFPRQYGQTPSEKLVLPAASSPLPDADNNQANVYEQHTVAMPPSYQPPTPDQPLPATYDAQNGYDAYGSHNTYTASKPVGAPPIVPYQATIGTTWRNDPAYKVLLAAIVLIIITGIAFTVYALNVFAQTASTQSKTGTTVTQKPITPQGTVDLKPTFSVPGGSATSNPTVGSQPTPGATVVPTAMPSPTVQPTQPPANANLTVQITNSPQQVNNGATVYVAIQASKPGISVQLIVTYNAPPGFYGSAIQHTDNGGNATLAWHVRVQMHGNHPVTARVIAVARDQNGHIAQSQMIIVQVTNNN